MINGQNGLIYRIKVQVWTINFFVKMKIIYLTGSLGGLLVVQQPKTLPNNGQNLLNILTAISEKAHDMIFVLTKN